MAYFPAGFPSVAPTLDDRRFWELCNLRRLCFQRCDACAAFRHPPTPICGHCQSSRSSWVEAPSVGRLFTYTIVHHPAHPAAAPALPYNVVLVEFAECGGVRLVSNVIDAAPGDLVAGAALALVWDEDAAGQWLPRFRLAR
jgi:uncharacterized OB-fold protein